MNTVFSYIEQQHKIFRHVKWVYLIPLKQPWHHMQTLLRRLCYEWSVLLHHLWSISNTFECIGKPIHFLKNIKTYLAHLVSHTTYLDRCLCFLVALFFMVALVGKRHRLFWLRTRDWKRPFYMDYPRWSAPKQQLERLWRQLTNYPFVRFLNTILCGIRSV